MKGRAIAAFVAQLIAATFSLMIAAYISIASSAVVFDPDIWWHIRIGDWIVGHGALPRVGVLSQHIERSWTAYSWAFDVLVSRLHRVYGLPGLPAFTICLQVLISFVFLVAIRRFAKAPWWSWLIATLSIYAFTVQPLRSYQFTLLFFTIELAMLFEAERRKDDRLLFWMAPLFLLWANIHIQFVYGMFVLGLYVATRFITRGPSTTLAGVLAAAVACSCIGPNWVRPYLIAINFASHPAPYQVIEEAKAISFRRPEHYVQLFLVMAACFVIGRLRRADTLVFRAALLLVAAMVSFRSMRDSWFVSIAAGFVIAEAVGERFPDAGDDGALVIRPVMQYAMSAALALVIMFRFAVWQGLTVEALSRIIDIGYPIQATQFVRKAQLAGPMYNDFNWGGFLIFNLSEYPVSIDPRGDLYGEVNGEDLLFRAINTINAGPGWQTDPDLLRARFVLIKRTYPLASALAADRHFKRVYEDHIADVFVRE